MAKKMAPKGNNNNTRNTTSKKNFSSPKGKKQTEGASPQSGDMSDHREQVAPDSSKGRGLGSAFAFAVGEIMTSAKEIKGSQSDFLGEPSEIIDPKQFAHSLLKG